MTIDTTKLPPELAEAVKNPSSLRWGRSSRESIEIIAQQFLDQQAKIEELEEEIGLRKTSGYEF